MARPKKKVGHESTVEENATVQPTINEQETVEETTTETPKVEEVVEDVKVEVKKQPRVIGTNFDTDTKTTKPVQSEKTNANGTSLVIIRGRGFINPNPQVVSNVVLEILKKRKDITIEYVTN